MPLLAAIDARERREVGRMVAQKVPAWGQLTAIDHGPAPVRSVVCDFGPFRRFPPVSIFGHSLLARSRVGAHRRRSERAPVTTDAIGDNVKWTVTARAESALEACALAARSIGLVIGIGISSAGGVGVVGCRLGGSGVRVRAVWRHERRRNALERGVDSRGGASRASEARGRNEAMARAMTKLRSGGYAAANCEVQLPEASLCPPLGRM
eukprot:1099375-Pleurochrysis_carterae.AAC.2